MSIATELTSMATKLQTVLNDCNNALAEKDAGGASVLNGLAAAIAAIESGGLQVATGTFKPTKTGAQTITVNGVGFKPTHLAIFLMTAYTASTSGNVYPLVAAMIIPGTAEYFHTVSGSQLITKLSTNSTGNNIYSTTFTDSGFELTGTTQSSYGPHFWMYDYSWLAIG